MAHNVDTRWNLRHYLVLDDANGKVWCQDDELGVCAWYDLTPSLVDEMLIYAQEWTLCYKGSRPDLPLNDSQLCAWTRTEMPTVEMASKILAKRTRIKKHERQTFLKLVSNQKD